MYKRSLQQMPSNIYRQLRTRCGQVMHQTMEDGLTVYVLWTFVYVLCRIVIIIIDYLHSREKVFKF